MRILVLLFLVSCHTLAAAVELLDLEGVCATYTSELEQRAQAQFDEKMRMVAKAGEAGCEHHCGHLDGIFNRLTRAASTQSPLAARTHWQLAVIRSPDEAAYALPGGHIVISEAFIDAQHLTDEEIAFVLAHEISHIVLQHECELLDIAQGIALPRGINRNVADLYAEMDFDMGLLLSLEPVMTQSEFEADYTGMLIAALAGYSPQAMLGFMEKMAAGEQGDQEVVATHPDSRKRLEKLQSLLPLAQRVREIAGCDACER